MPLYEHGDVSIQYEEDSSGVPLLLIPGGGLNSTIPLFNGNAPFNAIEELQDEYRCITTDLRATPAAARPPVCARSIGPGTRSPMTSSAGWGLGLCARRPDITMEVVESFLSTMYRSNADFVLTVTRDFGRAYQTPMLVLPDDVPAAPVRRGPRGGAPRAEGRSEPVSLEGVHEQISEACATCAPFSASISP